MKMRTAYALVMILGATSTKPERQTWGLYPTEGQATEALISAARRSPDLINDGDDFEVVPVHVKVDEKGHKALLAAWGWEGAFVLPPRSV